MSPRPLPWFRLYVEMVDDEKLRLLAFEDRWHYVALLCCKGARLLDAGDTLDLLRRKLAVKLGLAQRELEAAANRLAEVGLINAETFQPLAWDERQMRSDSSRDRVAAFRERKKQGGNVTVTAQDVDTDKDQEQEHKAKPPARSRARPTDAQIDLPDWVPVELWEAWLEVRRKIRAPNTAGALRLNLNKLEALRDQGQDPAAVLEQAVSRGWRGIFPLKDQHDRPNTGSSGRRESTIERVERINRELDERAGQR